MQMVRGREARENMMNNINKKFCSLTLLSLTNKSLWFSVIVKVCSVEILPKRYLKIKEENQ